VGLLTPPVGLNVFVVSRYTGRPVEEVFAGVWPHVFAHLLLIVLFVIFLNARRALSIGKCSEEKEEL
jgi:TRAP-type C4-dicarboxylate transport system permease large subunit